MKNRHRFALNLIWAWGLLVSPAGATNFSITVINNGLPEYGAYFTNAAAYWERMIPSYQNGAGFTGITIEANISHIDGPGNIVGQAGPTAYGVDGSGFALATTGVMYFDLDDFGDDFLGLAPADVQTVIQHEMAHVIGIGSLWELNASLYPNGLYQSGSNQYTGPSGLAGFKAEFIGQGAATFAPVELGGGLGTAGSHWNENETAVYDGGGALLGYSVANTGIVSSVTGLDMRYELMSGWIEPGQANYVSGLTRGSIRDLGYNTQTIWTSSVGSGNAAWSTADNWGGMVPASFDIATFPQTQPINNREVTLNANSYAVDTLQLANDWHVVIKNGTLNVTSIKATGGGTSTFQSDVTVGGRPTLTLANGSTLEFLNAGGTSVKTISGMGTITGNLTLEGTPSPGGPNTAVIIDAVGAINLNSSISGDGITKTGSGPLTLAGNSTYTGATTVSAGSLLINGALGNTAVTVASTATIGGNGSLAGSLHFDAGAKLLVSLADPLEVGGVVSFGGFDFGDLVGINVETVSQGTHTVLAGSNFLFANVGHFGLANAYTRGDGNQVYFDSGSLNLVVVPEPATLLLGALGLLTLLRRRRA